MASASLGPVYSATYSNVPVYEVILKEPSKNKDTRVMRRREDDWVNATHILIVAGFDKAARTKVLEREVQRGTHQKVQGGYGGYQGTWISLDDARALAQRYGATEKLSPILDYVPGIHSPPPAPKHTTAASNRARQAPASATSTVAPALPAEPSSSIKTSPDRPPRKRKAAVPALAPVGAELPADPSVDSQLTEGGSSSDEAEVMGVENEQSLTLQKRRRLATEQTTAMDLMRREQLLFSDELLDYLHLLRYADEGTRFGPRPQPPAMYHPDTPIDGAGHTVLHWAAALADLDLLVDFLDRGANIGAVSHLSETPLVFASIYTNSHQRRTMPRLISYLGTTIARPDARGCTALHHAAKLTSQRHTAPAGRYYFETILGFLSGSLSQDALTHVLDMQNGHGDTALTIVARVGDQASVRALLGYGASSHIVNDAGKSADDYLKDRNDRARWKERRATAVAPTPETGMPTDDDEADDPDDPHDPSLLLPHDLMTRRPRRREGMSGRAQTAIGLLERERNRLQDEQMEVLAACTRADEERAKVKKAMEVDQLRDQHAETNANINANTETVTGGVGTTYDSDAEQGTLEAAEHTLYELLLLDDQEYSAPLPVSSNTLSPRLHDNNNNTALLGDKEAKEGIHDDDEADLVKEMIDLDNKRRELLRHVAKETALVPTKAKAGRGPSRKTTQYKQLIARCLNVREEDVQVLAGSILEHLEAEREDRDRVGVVV